MKGNIGKCLMVVFLLAVSTSAFAGPYIGVAGGGSLIHDSNARWDGGANNSVNFNTGYGAISSFGYSSKGAGRYEYEFGYKTAGIKSTSLIDGATVDSTIYSYMANAYCDIKNKSIVTPYIGVGAGVLTGQMKASVAGSPTEKISDTVFGYQAMLGAGVKISKKFTLDLSYRFQSAVTDFDFGTQGKISYMSSNVYGGLRFNF